jgi:hypothetical protein
MSSYIEENQEENQEEVQEENQEEKETINIIAELDVAAERENFVKTHTELMTELAAILEKAKQIENQLIQTIRSQVSAVDFYKPGAETRLAEPPKKRIKLELDLKSNT